MLQLPIYNSELIEIPIPTAGVGVGQAIKFPTINRLKGVWMLGFAFYDPSLLALTPSGYENLGTLENIVVNIQNEIGQSPFMNFPTNAANPLQNFGFSQDVNPIRFDSSKSSVIFGAAVAALAPGATQKAVVMNCFFLHDLQFKTLQKNGYFKGVQKTM
jgi:hypothetical protein